MKNLIKAVVLLLSMVTGAAVHAQTDPHFSQYYVYPLWLNPALTGVMDGDYRVTAVYRNQWGSVSSPFSTPGVSADFVTNKNVNLGMNIMNQRTNTGGYNYLSAYGTMSYTGVRFGDHQITMGLAFGLINRRFDPSKFQTGDQWNPITGYNPSGGGTEVLGKTSALSFDAGAGIMYFDGTPGKKANVFAGFSAYHLTQPEDPFITGGTHEKMPVRYTGHGGIKLNVSEGVSFTPNLLYMRQGNAEEKMAGAYAQLRVNEEADFVIGANYRFKDAMSPYAGIYYKNFAIGVSYDVNASDLSKAAGNANSFEISLSFFGRSRRGGATADAVPFVHPRL